MVSHDAAHFTHNTVGSQAEVQSGRDRLGRAQSKWQGRNDNGWDCEVGGKKMNAMPRRRN